VSAKRLEAVGYGESRPLAPNRTRKDREINRRIEFYIVEEPK
jgi:flagellar motor protein MotB